MRNRQFKLRTLLMNPARSTFCLRWGHVGVSAMILTLTFPLAKAQQYQATQIAIPSFSEGPWGINDSGSVVGNNTVYTTRTGPFGLPALVGNDSATGTGINSSDTVVGYAAASTGYTHAITFTVGTNVANGTLTDIGTPDGAPGSDAFGINDLGAVVGGATNTSSND